MFVYFGERPPVKTPSILTGLLRLLSIPSLANSLGRDGDRQYRVKLIVTDYSAPNGRTHAANRIAFVL